MALEEYQGDLGMCCRCSACKFIPMQKVKGEQYAQVCPSIARYNYHAYSAGGRLNIAAAMLKDGMNYTDKLLDIVYNCQLCGACGVSCNYAMDMNVTEPIVEFRLKCNQDGKTNPALDKVIDGLRKQGSMVPAKGKRGAWSAGLKVKDATREKVDVLYHVGCLTSFDSDKQKLAKATVKILQKVGINFGIAGDDALARALQFLERSVPALSRRRPPARHSGGRGLLLPVRAADRRLSEASPQAAQGPVREAQGQAPRPGRGAARAGGAGIVTVTYRPFTAWGRAV